MKLINCVTAYKALCELSNEPLDITSAHTVVMAKREISPHVEFFTDKERELMEKYGNRDENGELLVDGSKFEIQATRYNEYIRERMELADVEVEITPRKLKRAPAAIKPATLEALEGFIEFPLEDEGNG